MFAKHCRHENYTASYKLFIWSDKTSELLHKINFQSWWWCSCDFGSVSSVSWKNSTEGNSCDMFLPKIQDCQYAYTSRAGYNIPNPSSSLLTSTEQAGKLLTVHLKNKMNSCLQENYPGQCKHNKIIRKHMYFRATVFMYCACAVPGCKHWFRK